MMLMGNPRPWKFCLFDPSHLQSHVFCLFNHLLWTTWMPGHFNFSKIILTKIIGFPLFKSKLNAFPWRTLVQTYPQPRIISTDAKKNPPNIQNNHSQRPRDVFLWNTDRGDIFLAAPNPKQKLYSFNKMESNTPTKNKKTKRNQLTGMQSRKTRLWNKLFQQVCTFFPCSRTSVDCGVWNRVDAECGVWRQWRQWSVEWDL